MSGISTLTESISEYIYHILNTLLPTIPRYIKNTTFFLKHFLQIRGLPYKALLVTMDVYSLYINILHEEGVPACREFLLVENIQDYLAQNICIIIEFILTPNTFRFQGQQYLQLGGKAMWTKIATSYTKKSTHKLENKLLIKYSLKSIHYCIYRDDIFLLWSSGQIKFFELYKCINNYQSTIKST